MILRLHAAGIRRASFFSRWLSVSSPPSPENEFPWTSGALCEDRRLREAVECLHLVEVVCVRKRFHVYDRLLEACVELRAPSEGKLVHNHMRKSGFVPSLFLNNRLLDLYVKSGCLDDAWQLFEEMPQRDCCSWNTMISGHVNHGSLVVACRMFEEMPEPNPVSWAVVIGGCVRNSLFSKAFLLFRQMGLSDSRPDSVVYTEVLRGAAAGEILEYGIQVHSMVIKVGVYMKELVRNTALDMYAKCGDMVSARRLFDEMPEPDDVSFNSLIAGYARDGEGRIAMLLYRRFVGTGLRISQFSFASVLSGCAGDSLLREGEQVHAHVVKTGFASNVFTGNAILDMYMKCRCLDNASKLFSLMSLRDGISWNGMISGYSREGYSEEAFNSFKEMLKNGVSPSQFTFSSVLSSCASTSFANFGLQVHCHTIKAGFDSQEFVSNALVDMYAKCGLLGSARFIFENSGKCNTVSWTVLIAGYAQNGCNEEALQFYIQMQRWGFSPDHATAAAVLKACACLTALNCGKQVHAHTTKAGLGSNVFTGSAIVGMYAKCGNMDSAMKFFTEMPSWNSVTWNGIIAGYAQNGEGRKALDFFLRMVENGTKPDNVTFVSVLHACSHAGIIDEGFRIFDSMSKIHGISPRADHYACMVDLLGRCGHLEEAERFIDEMPFAADSVVWLALLGSCRIHKNVRIAERAANKVFELETGNAAPYVLLCNIYSSAGLWDEVPRVRKLMKERGVKKLTGYSWIEAHSSVHVFVSNDRMHPQLKKIHAKIDELMVELKKVGYVPDKNYILQVLEDDEKETSLAYHSEKLAVAFGLINVVPPEPIRVMKNLRVCGDCHNAIKLISKISERVVILRDSNRFHHFANGICSCGDYW
ncbi:putative pentatricopeptide repeat-containing protein At2g01510 [Nymphaea colorata]|nr:putative pentatricopeptide repeat-containing protein At2g01510 [Nymphaea colorata]